MFTSVKFYVSILKCKGEQFIPKKVCGYVLNTVHVILARLSEKLISLIGKLFGILICIKNYIEQQFIFSCTIVK